MVHLDYRDARPIYTQIVDGYREQIQRSYRQLEAEGGIATVPGKGCFVCGVPQSAQDEKNKLLSAFDLAVTNLLAYGVHRSELIERLQKEGNDYA